MRVKKGFVSGYNVRNYPLSLQISMNIKEVKTAIKVGEFKLSEKPPNKIDINYTVGKEILENASPRAYLIVQDGVIKKIGASNSKGGIKATMSFYINAMTGSPGRPRFITHLLIAKALEGGSKVELYMISSPKMVAKLPGLFDYKEAEIGNASQIEEFCKEDYYTRESRYPDWNFKENNRPYPRELENQYMEYHRRRLEKRGKRAS